MAFLNVKIDTFIDGVVNRATPTLKSFLVDVALTDNNTGEWLTTFGKVKIRAGCWDRTHMNTWYSGPWRLSEKIPSYQAAMPYSGGGWADGNCYYRLYHEEDPTAAINEWKKQFPDKITKEEFLANYRELLDDKYIEITNNYESLLETYTNTDRELKSRLIELRSLEGINSRMENDIIELTARMEQLRKDMENGKNNGKLANNYGDVYNLESYLLANNNLNLRNMELTTKLNNMTNEIEAKDKENKKLKRELDAMKIKSVITEGELDIISNNKLLITNLIIRYTISMINPNNVTDVAIESNLYSLIMRLLKDTDSDTPKYIDQVIETFKRVIERYPETKISLEKRYKADGYNNFIYIIKIFKTLIYHNYGKDTKENTIGSIRYLLNLVTEFTVEDVTRLVKYCKTYLDSHGY